MMLRKSIERLRNSEVAVQSPILAEKLTCYAGILAAEGSLATAMTYLPDNANQVRDVAATSLQRSKLMVCHLSIVICAFAPCCPLSPVWSC